MIKILILMLLLCCFYNTYSQNCCDRLEKQAVKIDSLTKALRYASKRIQQLNGFRDSLQMKIKVSQDDSAKLLKLQSEKIKIENQSQQKTDSLKQLKIDIETKEKKISDCINNGEEKARERYDEGKQVVYDQFAKIYKETKSLDDLIISSSELSVERDLYSLGGNEDVKQKLKDLQGYFAAQNILKEKYNEQNLARMKNHLGSITQESKLLDALKTNIEDYRLCYDALKETIVKIIKIDSIEKANDEETQKLKLTKILSVLSSYIFNYDFNLNDYPYLTGIVLEIIKRKQPDANADITDLLEKL